MIGTKIKIVRRIHDKFNPTKPTKRVVDATILDKVVCAEKVYKWDSLQGHAVIQGVRQSLETYNLDKYLISFDDGSTGLILPSQIKSITINR